MERERRRTRRTPSAAPGKTHKSATSEPSTTRGESCEQCGKALRADDRALFVEEEVGRIFCSEECITSHFTPEIERLEREYLKHLSNEDLSGQEKEQLAHLRWLTLQEPDEVWRERTLAGDLRHTFISEFKPAQTPVWCVSICLLLRGEPSFLYLAFATRDPALVDHYRKGDRIPFKPIAKSENSTTSGEAQPSPLSDGLASDWTPEETLLAQLSSLRSSDDIPPEEFGLYQNCFEETLESPDEVWTQFAKLKVTKEDAKEESKDDADEFRVYRFIRRYTEGKGVFWYVILARETEESDQIEILDAFPTRDIRLVESQRQGEKDVGEAEPATAARVFH